MFENHLGYLRILCYFALKVLNSAASEQHGRHDPVLCTIEQNWQYIALNNGAFGIGLTGVVLEGTDTSKLKEGFP